jgi:prevent-host-death family protein
MQEYPMTVFDIHDAETCFSELLEYVSSGEEVVITKAGKPVARILPFWEMRFFFPRPVSGRLSSKQQKAS